ncbi:MAG TPA: BadF/BadG/BcrA/BcrD ATPase family protein [Bacteroidota bacterium]|nr:BadF/BadG/BcrA/BcrD ATPase family protein [Bacteroidota bacterium]
MSTRYLIGLDIGSTTVKAVVLREDELTPVWKDYRRHETRQAETALDFLERIETEFGGGDEEFRAYVTGSGARVLMDAIGARFVQEVNAVALAVEARCPSAGSAVELGGQDAKILIFQHDPLTGHSKKITSMNDKCAGGTGAVIDKISAKLRLSAEDMSALRYDGVRLHPVAGKCGVFAETDINGLQKQGVPPAELMASLFDSIVQQNLSVLTRGNTLPPDVLLLGGPNTFLPGMVEAWKHAIPLVWEERGVELPDEVAARDRIYVPEDAQYFAAFGCVIHGQRNDDAAHYKGASGLRAWLAEGRHTAHRDKAGTGLWDTEEELRQFLDEYRQAGFTPLRLRPGSRFDAYLGIDGGSTSTKGVLLTRESTVAFKAYKLSDGNPIDDTRQIIDMLRRQVEDQGASLRILGVGTTGYAKDMLKDALAADVALVETVAHTQAARRFYPDVDVICDVGGQDIKLILLHDGRVVDFKLNTQCSAGNGYFLQGTAESFGYDVSDFAEAAFRAREAPEFGYGCAVFLQSDIVDFQRQGWTREEIMAGLAKVLPKNIWLYVSQISNLEMLGGTFVLQGGTQRNLAAVKAQVDFIRRKFRSLNPRIIVHEHTGEAGAIGAAVEAARLHASGRETTFIGLDAATRIRFTARRDESTRCTFCKNNCLRTFIDVETPVESGDEQRTRRLIIATCEKGGVEATEDMRVVAKDMSRIRAQFPDYADIAARLAFTSFTSTNSERSSIPVTLADGSVLQRGALRIGMPRALNHFAHAPLFTAYLQSIGVPFDNIVFSSPTTDALFREGSKRGAIDPCFPSKLALSHVHNLLARHHARKPLHMIFFPMVDDMPSDLHGTQARKACPTITGTVESVKAAFIKERDLFAEAGVRYVHPFVNLGDERLAERQLFEALRPLFQLSRREHAEALRAGYEALHSYHRQLRERARETLLEVEREQRIAIVLLGRPYHNDPGINHGILAEFQKLGYPVLTQDALPTDADILERVFGEDMRQGLIADPMSIDDVWKNSYSENTNRKVWAAKYVARHPNLVALELSSFKCGHDGPIYAVVQEIVESSGTPYFSFKDVDENKPSGSIRIRVETIGYFLRRYRDTLAERLRKRDEIEAALRAYEARLLAALGRTPAPHPRFVAPEERASDVVSIELPRTLHR